MVNILGALPLKCSVCQVVCSKDKLKLLINPANPLPLVEAKDLKIGFFVSSLNALNASMSSC
jgi:hypothetical protein